MTSEISEKDLEQIRTRNDKLREQIAEQQQKAAEATAMQSRVVEYAQLETETAKLERQLELAKAAAKTASKTPSEGPLAQVTETLEAAQAQVGLPTGVVDTTEDPKKDGGNS